MDDGTSPVRADVGAHIAVDLGPQPQERAIALGGNLDLTLHLPGVDWTLVVFRADPQSTLPVGPG